MIPEEFETIFKTKYINAIIYSKAGGKNGSKTDIEIAQSIELKPIVDVVEKLGISYDDLELYGKYKAKLSFDKIRAVESNPVGKLILVTAINQLLLVKENQHYHWTGRRLEQDW